MASRIRVVPTGSALGAYLYELRRVAGLRQRDVTEKVRELGVGPGFRPSGKELWAWEHGVNVPSSRTLAILISILHGSPNDTAGLLQYDSIHQPLIRAALLASQTDQARELAQASIAYGATMAHHRRMQHTPGVALTSTCTPPQSQSAEFHQVFDLLQAREPHLADILVRFARFLQGEGERTHDA